MLKNDERSEVTHSCGSSWLWSHVRQKEASSSWVLEKQMWILQMLFFSLLNHLSGGSFVWIISETSLLFVFLQLVIVIRTAHRMVECATATLTCRSA